MNVILLRLAAIILCLILATGGSQADQAAADNAVMIGSRDAIRCIREARSAEAYRNDQLNHFRICVGKADNFGNESTDDEMLQKYAIWATAYYLAIENYGNMTQKDYGTRGVANMQDFSETVKHTILWLEEKGYTTNRICRLLTWINCDHYKALPKYVPD